MKKSEKNIVYFIFKTTVVLLCWLFFIFLTYDIFDKFSNQFTSNLIRFKAPSSDEKVLPGISMCPWKSFKKEGFHFNESSYMDNSFGQHELFGIVPYGNEYSIETIKSVLLGRCYMINHLKKIKDSKMSYIALKKSTDITGCHLLPLRC
jgi:hypothetical protein